jgi:prepilin-type processing-associated H-X9-DG protein
MLVELLVATAVIAIRKVWEQHDGQNSLLFCDGQVEAVSSGDRFTKRATMLCADGVYASA